MKTRIREKQIKQKIKKILSSLGVRIKDLKWGTGYYWPSRSRAVSFRVQGIPDFLFGIWMVPSDGKLWYFGQFEDFIDKFRPTMVDYSMSDSEEFKKFLGSLLEDYQRRVIELLRDRNIDVGDYPEELSDQELWEKFQEDLRIRKFKRSHYDLSEEEYQEALREKSDFQEFLKSESLIDLWEWNRNKGVYWKIGNFSIFLKKNVSQEYIDYLADKMYELKYNLVARPNIYVSKI